MYYAMMRSTNPGRWIGSFPYLDGIEFKEGAVITVPLPDTIQAKLKPLNPDSVDHSPHMPAFLNADGPLYRDDLIEAMRSFGVTNLQTFNVALTDPDNGKV